MDDRAMISVAFDGCAGWLHGASGARGAVLVPAMGFEGLCSRHALRCLAGRLAISDVPTLRFDYRGSGDSSEIESGHAGVATWMADVSAAIRALREMTGVTEVTLIGLRLGALVALEAARRDPAITRLALLAPPASGAAYLREMRALAQILGGPAEIAPSELTVAGFRIAEATALDLKQLDPAASPDFAGRDVLVLAPEAARGALRVARALEEAGAAVHQERFAGYQELICDPTASQVPDAALSIVAAWVAQGRETGDAAPSSTELASHGTALEQDGWSERGIVVGAGGAAGVLCQPRTDTRLSRGVVFLNAGGINHVGWAGMTVAMARRLAEGNVASLRLDFPGTGDAAPWAGAKRMTFYDSGTHTHVAAAIDSLAARGATDITLVGTCSGAHHALHGVLRDDRVGGLVLLNLLCFIWGPGYAVPLNAWKLSRPQDMASRQRRLAGGDAPVGLVERLIDRLLPLARTVVKRTVEAAKSGLAPLIQRIQGGGRNAVEGWFRRLSARGVRIALVYGEEDAGRLELARYMGPDGARATGMPGLTLTLIADTDHALTPATARTRYSDIVFDVAGGEDAATAAPIAFRTAAE